MPSEFWRSVRVTWLDRAGTVARLRRAARALGEAHPEVEQIVLFGSLARGDAVPGSDADLLVVLRDSPLPFLDRVPLYTPEDCGIGVDVFPYTQDEIARMREEPDSLVAEALTAGILLYTRPPAPGCATEKEGKDDGTSDGADRETG